MEGAFFEERPGMDTVLGKDWFGEKRRKSRFGCRKTKEANWKKDVSLSQMYFRGSNK